MDLNISERILEEEELTQNRKVSQIDPTPLEEEGGTTVINNDYIKLNEVQNNVGNDREKLSYHQAARYGNVAAVERYLVQFRGKKKKINRLNKQELSALHYAVRYGHMDVVRLLIKNKANLDVSGADGAQPIHYAAKYFKAEKHIAEKQAKLSNGTEKPHLISEDSMDTNGLANALKPKIQMVDVITYLLKNGADVNAVDNYNLTPLNYAAVKGNTDAVGILLKWPGIDIEIADTSGGTALHNACGNGHTEAAKLLLMAGALLMVWDNERMNPLHYAATGDGAFILKEIIEDIESQGGKIASWTIQAILDDQDNQGQSLLHLAVDVGRYDTCHLLLEKGANVNLCRNGFVTPLHLAAATGNLDIVKLLVASGANIDAENVINETPLHRAAIFNRYEVVEFLLSKGSFKDSVDQDNSTPVILAAKNGNVESVELLLKQNVDLSIVDSSERTAIYCAAEESANDVLKVLLEHVKEEEEYREMNLIEMCDRFENTPLHIASKKGFKHTAELLLQYGATENPCNDEELTPLHLAAINGNLKVMKTLLLAKPSIINDEDESGNTALHLAALNGHHKTIDLLIDYGASVDPRNSLLWTPLDCSAAKGHVKCVVRLLDRGSPIDPMDLAYTTPLHLASREGHYEVVKVLLDNGADVTLLANTGKNALDMAIDNSHRNVVLTLTEHHEWLSVYKNRSKTSQGMTTPFRQLIMKMPDVAYIVLNKCMKFSKALPQDHPDYRVQLFYDLLDDTYADWSPDFEENEHSSLSSKSVTSNMLLEDDPNKLSEKNMKFMEKTENHTLAIMCEYERGNLLNHPVVMSLIYDKWGHFGRVVFYSKFLLYFLFLFFLTGYVLVAVPLHPKKSSEGNESCVPRATENDRNRVEIWIFVRIGRIVLLALGGFQLLLEIGQIITRKLNYFFDFVNWMEWSIYVLAMIFVWETIDDYISAAMGCSNVRITIGCCAIFLSWIDLLLFFQKFPSLGIYVVMFTDVLKTFLKFSLTFSLFVVAFGLGFYTLFYNGSENRTFENIGRTLIKTLVMMIGEFDFDDLFNADIHQPVIAWFLFVLFVIIMTILLMNLLVGLAVDDIKGVLDQAVLNRVAMQVYLVLDVEKTLPRRFRKRYIAREKTVYPNREFSWYQLKSHVTTMDEIENAINPEKSVSDVVQEHTESIHVSVDRLKKDFKDMGKQMKNIEEMMETLLKHSNIINDTDDFNQN